MERAGRGGESSLLSSAQIAAALGDGVIEGAERMAASNQGEVFRISLRGHMLAVKTPIGSGPVGWLNRLGLQREARIYRRLAGLTGFPHCYGLFSQRWLVLDFIDGKPFRETSTQPAFFDRLLAVIQSMHRRGVAHGDLKRKSNLLVSASGDPVILDFGAAVMRRDGFHPTNQRLFQYLRQTDLNAWVKLKYGGYSDVSESDRALLRRSWLERVLSRSRR